MRVRDRRDGGWFWAQNELFDVFQPLIGPYGVAVYAALCRLVPRDPEGRVSLRELEAASGASKDTANRAIAKLVALGMVSEVKAGPKTKSCFDMLDLRTAASVGIAELERRLSVADRDNATKKLPFSKGKHTSEPMTVADGDSSERSSGQPAATVFATDLSQKGGSSVATSAPGLFKEEKKNVQERENAREGQDVSMVCLIAVAHPRGRLRHWTPYDVPHTAYAAILDAIAVEAEKSQITNEAAAKFILHRVRTLCDEIPRDSWRFVKDIVPFMQLREYRSAGSDLVRLPAASLAPQPKAGATIGMVSQTEQRDYSIFTEDNETYWRTVQRLNPLLFRDEAPDWARSKLAADAA